MASSQEDQGKVQQTEDNPASQTDAQAAQQIETEAVQAAKSELQKTMAEVVENPPTEPPPPPSLNTPEINYEEPLPDPYNKAITYLEQHNILQIFQGMTANIIYQKPDNPLDFMISEIADMKKSRDSKKKFSASKK
ncbi:hypothetical protein ACOMHN_028505 [Nucella lapillus]